MSPVATQAALQKNLAAGIAPTLLDNRFHSPRHVWVSMHLSHLVSTLVYTRPRCSLYLVSFATILLRNGSPFCRTSRRQKRGNTNFCTECNYSVRAPRLRGQVKDDCSKCHRVTLYACLVEFEGLVYHTSFERFLRQFQWTSACGAWYIQ